LWEAITVHSVKKLLTTSRRTISLLIISILKLLKELKKEKNLVPNITGKPSPWSSSMMNLLEDAMISSQNSEKDK
jgi:hypothetical protein